MSAFSQMVDDTILYLYGFTAAQDQATYLSASVSASAVSLPVADTTAISRGTLEIEDELIWVDSISGSNLVVPPYGRGFRGTTAATHASGVRVTANPLFPRKLVKDAINQAVLAVFPLLTAVDSASFSFNPARTTYALPAGANSVISATWQSIGPSREWLPIRRYRVDPQADPTTFTSGATLSVYDAVVPGRTVRVVFSKAPVVMSADADVFTTVTGLPASAEDVIRLGAAMRLVPFLDSPHLQGFSAEADFSANMRPVGGAAQLGRFLMQQYQIRLQEEANKQDNLYPHRSHYTR